ncbi:hypothetical protein BH10PLA1_BH10PLA1_08800 [soil metagenome]
MRWLLLVSLALMAGCSTTRTVTFTAEPGDADLRIDDVPRGKGPVVQDVKFKGKEDVHTFAASRKGFKDQEVELRRDDKLTAYNIVLRPQSKKLTFAVLPVPGTILVDGRPIGNGYTRQITAELEFTVDANDNWTSHKVRVERPNFAPAEITINYADTKNTYVMNLEPLRKTMTISSSPAGAEISVDGDPLGKAPAVDSARAFAFDIEAGAFLPHTIRAVKAGFDPIEKTISWDDGKTEYTVDMLAKNKTVRIVTDPANCTVDIDGTKVLVDDSGTATAKLDFPPINDQGELKTYTATVSKKTADSEWTPQKIAIGWDNGKADYSVVLREILTKPVPLVIAQPQRTDTGWQFVPKTISTIAWKDVTEGSKKISPSQLTRLPKGTGIDTIAVSPDGSSVLFTILIIGTEKNDFRSQMMLVKTDGTGGPTYFSDGKSLDLTPSFTPDGTQIVFSSNRAGTRLSIWQMSAVGAPGITQLTTGDTNDLWPSIDSDPRPRMYYQTLVDTRPDPRLFMTQLGTTIRTDLTQQGGSQPRVSPKADSVVFTAVNERTGKRDLFLMSDKGGTPQNLTNTPDVDEFDPAWNKDGSQLAFVSDRGMDPEKRRNYDIWTMDVTKAEAPAQITSNGSWDDSPAWDNTGENIYFRSNRGGDWNVWKAPAK